MNTHSQYVDWPLALLVVTWRFWDFFVSTREPFFGGGARRVAVVFFERPFHDGGFGGVLDPPRSRLRVGDRDGDFCFLVERSTAHEGFFLRSKDLLAARFTALIEEEESAVDAFVVGFFGPRFDAYAAS